ncbi:hypothetical protein ACFX15_030047 [Malus domestica]
MTGSSQEVPNPSEDAGTRSRLTRELCETKKIADEALKKAEARNAIEDVTGTKRQRTEEEDKEGSSSSAPSSNRVEVTKNQGEGGYRGKGLKR